MASAASSASCACRRAMRGWWSGSNEAEVLQRTDRELLLAYLQLGLLRPAGAVDRLVRRRAADRRSDPVAGAHRRAHRARRSAGARVARGLGQGVRAAHRRAQRHGAEARRSRAGTARGQQPPRGARVERRAVGPRQPARLRRAARRRMAAGRQARPAGRAADDRRRPLQAVQRPLRPCRRRRVPAPDRQAAAGKPRPAKTTCRRVTAARNSRCCCPAPTSTRRSRPANGCAARSRSCASRTRRRRTGR